MWIIIIYALLFLVIASLVPRSCSSVSAQKKIEAILCAFLIFIFFGLRGLSVLNDTSHYYHAQLVLTQFGDLYTNSIFDVDKTLNFEIGFQVLQRFIGKYISSDPHALIIISALILTIATIWYFSKSTNKIAVCIFFMLSTFTLMGQFSAIRQSYAIMCFYVSCFFYEKQKYALSFGLIYLATLFHSSAIILFIPLLISFLPVSKKNILIIIAIGLCVIIALYPILYTLDFGDSIYVSSALARQSIALASSLSAIFICILLGCSLYLPNKYNIAKPSSLFIWTSIICLLFAICAIRIPVFDRFVMYLMPSVILVFTHYIYHTPRAPRKILYSICILVLVLRMAVVLEYKNEWYHLVPYKFYNFNEVAPEYEFGY